MIYIGKLLCRQGVQNFVLPYQNTLGEPNLAMLTRGECLKMTPPIGTLAFKGHCKTQHPTCTEKYCSDRIDGAVWGIKMLPHIQDKCDCTLIFLDGISQLLNSQ